MHRHLTSFISRNSHLQTHGNRRSFIKLSAMLENETYAPLTFLKPIIACARKGNQRRMRTGYPRQRMRIKRFLPILSFSYYLCPPNDGSVHEQVFSKRIVFAAFCPVYIKMLECAEKLRGNATDAPPMFVAFFSFPRQRFRKPPFSLSILGSLSNEDGNGNENVK